MSAHDDDEIDDASLASMRSVWLSMRDEDPPAAGMSALMAAAAAKATELRDDQPSWWQRALAQLRRPPALAFATVMILIGGAVLVTRNQDTMKVEETAPAATELRVQERTLEPPVAAPVIGTDSATTESPPPPKEEVKQRPKPAPKPPVKNAAKLTLDGDRVGPNEPTRDDRFEANAEEKPAVKTGTKSIETAPGMVQGRAPEEKTSAPPPSDDAGETVTLSDTGPKKPQATPPNEQLARQAESAASRGDCAAVRTIVARMRKQDEAFYKSRLGKNAAVTKCL
jgi:hypothetical protein